MPHGYKGRILHLDLSTGDTRVEEPGEIFHRRYFGGRNLIAYYLLKNLKPKIDPLGPEERFKEALVTYYGMAGWDPATSIPTRERLEELDTGWVAEELARWGRLL